jgi:carbonic anhydrase/acetyltransferase-like protein (isoleucine patch superfamily)
MLIEHEGRRPQVPESAYVAPTAVLCGDVGRGSEVRVNGVVHVNSRLEPDTTVPIGWVAAGDPAGLFPPEAHEQLWEVQEPMDFPGTVFGLPRGEASMDRVCARYAERFGRHRGDRVLE